MSIARTGRTAALGLILAAAALMAVFAVSAPASATAKKSSPASRSAAGKKRIACKKARRKYGSRSARARRACVAKAAGRGKKKTTATTTTTDPATTTTTDPAATTTTDPAATTTTDPAATTTTDPAPSDGTIPSTASVWFDGDYSTGSWSQWDSANDDCRAQDHTVLSTFAGKSSVSSHTVTPSSTLGQAGTRCLLYNDPKPDAATAKSHAYAGAESWYEDWLYFPSTYKGDPDTDWNWTLQLHNFPDGGAPAVNVIQGAVNDSSDDGSLPHGQGRLSMRICGGGVDVNGGNGGSCSGPGIVRKWIVGPPLVREHWYHTVVHVKWSPTSAGHVDYWLDGARLGAYDGPNLYNYSPSSDGYNYPEHAGQAYFSVGYYRSSAPTYNDTVYHAGTRVYKP